MSFEEKSLDFQNYLLVHMADAIINYVKNEGVGLAFIGGSRGVGYNVKNSDVDVYVFIPAETQSAFRDALKHIGFERDRSKEEEHKACFVFSNGLIDVCVVNEKDDFENVMFETAELRKMINKNKKLQEFSTHLCGDFGNEGGRVFGNLQKMLMKKKKKVSNV